MFVYGEHGAFKFWSDFYPYAILRAYYILFRIIVSMHTGVSEDKGQVSIEITYLSFQLPAITSPSPQ